MKEIAIYGKGGIGKSTLSANISAAISLQGKRILQIGCDPKHDSTRLLMKDRKINTVLDYIRVTGASDYKLKDILFKGFNDIGCIEAGGPEPGVGCAGRGIITAFELLEKFHIKENYDVVLYDVLGDVVCGGFAVPIRREYSDTIFLVTSGEYMALYAANNILRGIKNYDNDKCRVAGILYNSRNVKNEDRRVGAFAEAVGLPIFAKIPRSDVFSLAEKENKTVVELQSESGGEILEIFEDVAHRILENPKLYPAVPMEDEELEELIFYTEEVSNGHTAVLPSIMSKRAGDVKVVKADKEPVADGTEASSDEVHQGAYEDYDAGYMSKNVLRDEPLHGCAFNGAMGMSIHLRDVAIVAHSPKSCLYLSYQSIGSAGRRGLFERGTLLPTSLSPNIISTDMDESDMIFGATEKLMDLVAELQRSKEKPKAIVVISSCPAGIIGDDVEKVKALSTEACPIVVIKADGNLTGDYLQGMLMVYTQLAEQIVDPMVKPEENVVNIVFEKVFARNTEKNLMVMKDFLGQLGLKINCRFLCNTDFDSIKNFCSARLNLLAYKDYTGNLLEKFFSEKYGCEFFDRQFPTGFDETAQWLRGLGEIFGKSEIAEAIVEKNREIYRDRIEKIKPYLNGKKIFIVSYNHELDWILQTAIDIGMKILKLGIVNFSQDEGFRSRIPESKSLIVEEDYDYTNLQKDIELLKPDILLSNYESNLPNAKCFVDTIPMCPDNGFFSGLLMAERWKNLLNSNLEGEWKNDKKLFDKYYS